MPRTRTTGPPARGYSWPPLQPGHTLSMRHGVWSKRRTDPVAAELVEALLSDRPDLERFPEAVHAWSRAEARCLLLAEWLSMPDASQKATEGALRHLASFERLAAQLRNDLGLTPTSEARLAKERAEAAAVAVDLEAVRQKGREALQGRLAAVEALPSTAAAAADEDEP